METEQSLQIIDNNDENFLLFFKPKKVNTNICSIRLETSAKLISIVFLACFIFHFIYSFSSERVCTIIISSLLCVGYILCCIYLYICAVNFNYRFSRIAYLILEAIIIFKSILAVLYFLLILFGIFPYYYSYSLKKRFWSAFGFFILNLVDIGIMIFFLWIIFAFMIVLKEKEKSKDNNNLIGDYAEIPNDKDFKINENENKDDK